MAKSAAVIKPLLTEVVNIRDTGYDVYIGRAMGTHKDGYFGNPYRIGPDGTREEVIEKFRWYFLGRLRLDPEYRRRILALSGLRIGCYCHPEKCHGDIIAEWLNQRNGYLAHRRMTG